MIVKILLKIVSVSILLSLIVNTYAVDIIDISKLQPGDIIFWAEINSNDRAGHVAVITDVSSLNESDIKIVHATDNPKYNAFVRTHILPSSKLLSSGKEYKVIRLRNTKLISYFIKLLNSWVNKISFDKNMELLMNKWDDSLIKYSTETKLKLQNVMYQYLSDRFDFHQPQKGMCSEIIIKALQQSFNRVYNTIPTSLHLDQDCVHLQL